MKAQRGGLSLLELMVALGLLSLMMVMMFFIYRQGASAWKKTEAQTQLLQNLQVFTNRLSRETERSIYASAAADPGPSTGTAVSMLSCWSDMNSRYDYSGLTRGPIWQKYLVFYYNNATQEVLLREIPLTPPGSTAVPLAGMAAFRTGGRALARNVTQCNFTLQDRLLEVQLELKLKRYGSPSLEVLQFPCRVFFRN